MTLVEFLRARLDEDEQRAQRAATQWDDEDVRYEWEDLPDDVFAHARSHDPARVLAEVEAKRKLLHSHYDYTGVCPRCFDWQNRPTERERFPCEVVRLLALPYAAHDDYQAEWRP